MNAKQSLSLIALFVFGISSAFTLLGCYACPPPDTTCCHKLPGSGKKLELRVTRHYSLRPKRVFYVTRDSAGNYLQEGEDLHYYLTGQVKMKEHFKDGKRHGLSEIFYENGHKKGELPYRLGRLDGEALAWHENGRLKMKKTWKDGKLHGSQIHFDKNGEVLERKIWKNNKLTIQQEKN